MTSYPLDLILQGDTTAGDVATELAALPAGRDGLINFIMRADGPDGETLAHALHGQNRITTVNLRLERGNTYPDQAKALAAFCGTRGIAFHVDLLIPADADAMEFALQDKGALVPIIEATRACSNQGLSARWLIPLTSDLVHHLEGLVSLAFQHGAVPVLLPGAVLDPKAADLTGDDRLFAWDFITYRVLDEDAHNFSRDHLAAYHQLAADLKQASSSSPHQTSPIGAALLAGVAGTGPKGHGRGKLISRRTSDISEVLGFGLSAHLRSVIAPAPKPNQPDPKMPFVLLIGAYGGEHIGDAAILGGVLGRIHARHGTHRAILMTQRPNHTRHLMPMLDVPVEVDVWDYTYANIARALRDVDGVVFAGGPLAEMPKQLVRHLETAARAKRKGLPFIMEGIGPNTFPRLLSRITARKLVKLADRISIRVREDATRAVIAGCEIEIGRDPAFDYLDTRKTALSRLPAYEPDQIEALLAGTGDRPVIGVNLRPIGHVYTPSVPGQTQEAYTHQIVAEFEREFAKGLMDFAHQAGTNPCFVFFPMNAIQFGMSDLRSAWRIIQHLEPGTDFRIWQADASLDGVVALLRRMDAVIAMRFHAAIFALSQGRPVVGIDYRIGKRDKVAAVLADAGAEENCRRIDELRADWLVERLQEVCPPKAVGEVS